MLNEIRHVQTDKYECFLLYAGSRLKRCCECVHVCVHLNIHECDRTVHIAPK
jgi:hypothetical protein